MLNRQFLNSGDFIKIGRFDATLNEISYPGVRILGYPTMYVFVKRPNKVSCSESLCGAKEELETNLGGNTCCSPALASDYTMDVIEYNEPRTVKDIRRYLFKIKSELYADRHP